MAIINRFYEYQTDDDGRIVCFQTTGQLAGGWAVIWPKS